MTFLKKIVLQKNWKIVPQFLRQETFTKMGQRLNKGSPIYDVLKFAKQKYWDYKDTKLEKCFKPFLTIRTMYSIWNHSELFRSILNHLFKVHLGILEFTYIPISAMFSFTINFNLNLVGSLIPDFFYQISVESFNRFAEKVIEL